MPEQKRYVVSCSFYIYAENDRTAFEISEKIASKQRTSFDNRFSIDELGEQPFAKSFYRKINIAEYIKQLL